MALDILILLQASNNEKQHVRCFTTELLTWKLRSDISDIDIILCICLGFGLWGFLGFLLGFFGRLKSLRWQKNRILGKYFL